MVKPRISDDRALKVAGVYPGRSAVSHTAVVLKITGIRDCPVYQMSPAPAGNRVLTVGEPVSGNGPGYTNQHEYGSISFMSDQTARGEHHTTEVSRGHIKPEEKRQAKGREASPR